MQDVKGDNNTAIRRMFEGYHESSRVRASRLGRALSEYFEEHEVPRGQFDAHGQEHFDERGEYVTRFLVAWPQSPGLASAEAWQAETSFYSDHMAGPYRTLNLLKPLGLLVTGPGRDVVRLRILPEP